MADDGSLVAGQHFRMDFIHAQLFGHMPGGDRLVAGDHDHPHAPLAHGGHHACRFFPWRVGNGQQGTGLLFVRQPDHGMAGGSQTLGLRGQLGTVPAQLLHQPRIAQPPALPFHRSADATARQVFECLHGGRRDAPFVRGSQHGLGQRVVAAGLQRGGDGQHGRAILRHPFHQLRSTLGEGAGLVHQQGAHLRQVLQCLAIAKEHTQFGGTTGTHQNGGGGGQTHGARTGDDQHRHGGHQRMVECRCRPPEQPGGKGEYSDDQHDGAEDPDDLVGQLLDGQFAGLGLFHHADDLCQQGIAAQPVHPHSQQAVVHQGAGLYFITGFHGPGHGFAGEHGHIQPGLAFQHRAIHRHALAGTHPHLVTGVQPADRYRFFLSVPQVAGGIGLQTNELVQGAGGALLGPLFQILAQQDDGNDDGGSLEIEMAAVFRKPRRYQQNQHGVEPGSPGAGHYQRIHVRRGVQPGLPAGAEKAQTRPEQHRRGQYRLYPGPEGGKGRPCLQPAGKGREEVTAHGQYQYRQGQCKGPPHIPGHGLQALLLAVILLLWQIPIQHGGVIPGITNDLHKVFRWAHGRQIAYLRPFRGQVDTGIQHAGLFFQRPFHPRATGGAGHALHAQLHLGGLGFIAQRLDGFQNGAGRRPVGLQVDVRLAGGQVHLRLHPVQLVELAFDAAGTGRAGHAFDIQL